MKSDARHILPNSTHAVSISSRGDRTEFPVRYLAGSYMLVAQANEYARMTAILRAPFGTVVCVNGRFVPVANVEG